MPAGVRTFLSYWFGGKEKKESQDAPEKEFQCFNLQGNGEEDGGTEKTIEGYWTNGGDNIRGTHQTEGL